LDLGCPADLMKRKLYTIFADPSILLSSCPD
jgi:hypothetical protein